MNVETALLWSTRLFGLSLAIQSLEFVLLGERPERLHCASPAWLGRVARLAAWTNLGAGLFLGLNGDPRGCFVAAPLAWLIAVRFGGTFNGGSDYLTMVVAVPLAFFAAAPSKVSAHFAVLSIGMQWLLSYAIAGLAKLGDADWRAGRALFLLATRGTYSIPPPVARLLARPAVGRALGYGTLVFECAAPLALVDWRAMTLFAVVAVLFHAGVALTLGLNRFFWAWLAAVPCGLALPDLLR